MNDDDERPLRAVSNREQGTAAADREFSINMIGNILIYQSVIHPKKVASLIVLQTGNLRVHFLSDLGGICSGNRVGL
jgi:hypothetical protein